MRKVGYKKHAANKPYSLTRSKGFQQLWEQELPDDLLLKRHKFLIKHRNPMAVSKGLDMAYKVKGAYKIESDDHNEPIQVNIAIQNNLDRLYGDSPRELNNPSA